MSANHDHRIADEALMHQFQHGDAGAFETLYLRHKKSVYSYILRYTGSEQDTHELFQEVFIKIHKAAPTYEPTAKFMTWMFTIVRNLCIDHYRRQRLRHHASMDENYEDGFSLHETVAAEGPNAESQSSYQELAGILEKALAKINTDQREVFLMREQQGLKFEEIALVLEISVNTAKSRMRYALEALRKFLKKSSFKELLEEEERLRRGL